MRPCRIISVFENFDPCAELGVLMPFALLEKESRLEHRPFTTGKAGAGDVAWADAVILQRLFRPQDVELLIAAKELGKPVLYDIDDNLLDVPLKLGPVALTYAHPHNRHNMKVLLKHADMVKAGSPALAEALRPYTSGEPVVLTPLNPQELYAPVRRPDDSVFRFVHAASPHNYLELEDIAGRAVQRIMETYGPAVHFYFFGGTFAGPLKDAKNATVIPHLPMNRFMKVFTSTAGDAALACIEDNSFNRCKTNNKFREYSARGFAGVYSDIPVYGHCVRHGETGLLAANDEQSWFEAMRFLVENPDKARNMGDAAREFAEKNYTVEANAEAWWKDVLLPLLERKTHA